MTYRESTYRTPAGRSTQGADEHHFTYEGPDGKGAFVSLYRKQDLHSPVAHLPEHGQWEESGQGRLFQSKPEELRIEQAFAEKGASHAVVPLLGIAAETSVKKYGKLPGADASLSPDSHRIVSRLVGKGVIDWPSEDAKAGPTNRWDKEKASRIVEDAIDTAHGQYAPEIKASRVLSGSQFARAVLRDKSKNEKNTGAEQPPLF